MVVTLVRLVVVMMMWAPGCRATGAQALVSLGTPTADELGFAKALSMEEIGGQMVIRLEQDAKHGRVRPEVHSCQAVTLVLWAARCEQLAVCMAVRRPGLASACLPRWLMCWSRTPSTAG